MLKGIGVHEKDAKKKWCRHGRMPFTVGLVKYETNVVNRDREGQPISFCLGSKCMDWETIEEQDDGEVGRCGVGLEP